MCVIPIIYIQIKHNYYYLTNCFNTLIVLIIRYSIY